MKKRSGLAHFFKKNRGKATFERQEIPLNILAQNF